eukprot:COSAG02_NODE_1053_length_14943_cov_3.871076_14_plen_56_part_00
MRAEFTRPAREPRASGAMWLKGRNSNSFWKIEDRRAAVPVPRPCRYNRRVWRGQH